VGLVMASVPRRPGPSCSSATPGSSPRRPTSLSTSKRRLFTEDAAAERSRDNGQEGCGGANTVPAPAAASA
jgi:hypothetical protein